jgi:hypothetical protein
LCRLLFGCPYVITLARFAARLDDNLPALVTRQEHLAQADRLIGDCMKHIALQREIITTEYEQGLPTDLAASMLRALEESLRVFEKHRKYIVDRLKDTERP